MKKVAIIFFTAILGIAATGCSSKAATSQGTASQSATSAQKTEQEASSTNTDTSVDVISSDVLSSDTSASVPANAIEMNEWGTFEGTFLNGQEVSVMVTNVSSGSKAEAILKDVFSYYPIQCHLDSDMVLYAVTCDIQFNSSNNKCNFPTLVVSNSVPFEYAYEIDPENLLKSSTVPLFSVDPDGLMSPAGFGDPVEEDTGDKELYLVKNNTYFFAAPEGSEVSTITFELDQKELTFKVN